MNKKLYDLMNWPDIEGVVYSEYDKPKSLLGGHTCPEGFLIQVYRPDAVEVAVHIDGKKPLLMEKVDEGGFFAALVSGKKKQKYTLTVENVKGRKENHLDPYSFGDFHADKDFKSFICGTCDEAWKVFGSRVCVVDGVEGTCFTVWAPDAARVSVVGTFNHWDGRLHMMEKISDDGIFELFIPGIAGGTEYNYEVKYHGGKTVTKLDPYARNISTEFTSIVMEKTDATWTDQNWMKNRAKKQDTHAPISVYEVSLEAWANSMGMKGSNYRNLAESICAYVQKTAYTHVELLPVCEYKSSDMMGYGTVGYFAPTGRFGSGEDFKAFVEVFHKAGIGVLMDWNGAYFSDDSIGLSQFDGTELYGSLHPRLEKYPTWKVTTFAYEKPQVRSFLQSSIRLWLEEYHIDGIRIDGVASMMYLDYGKNPGEWTPNIYGGGENLAAEKFMHALSKQIHQKFHGVILIAEESSGWAGVTIGDEDLDGDNSLGFDYKWDYNWKNDFLSFINFDPLFRKGVYGKLTFAMLYHYNESYMLELSHDEFTEDKCSFQDMMSGDELTAKLADMRTSYGFMYTHPGRKLLCMGQDIGLPCTWSVAGAMNQEIMEQKEYQQMMIYIRDLNRLYQKHPALYEQDDLSDGFEWIDSVSADETVLSYIRRDDDGRELLVVLNFTPVMRQDFRIGVIRPGKYKVVFNSDEIIYGGKGIIKSKVNLSEDVEKLGREESITVSLPASSMVVYEYEPYTDVELQEIAINKQARIAKEKAEREAEIARQLKEQAEAEAEAALEAERKAKEAAEAALKAQAEAEKKAAAAIKASQKIDAETKKKLEALKQN